MGLEGLPSFVIGWQVEDVYFWRMQCIGTKPGINQTTSGYGIILNYL